MDILSPSLLAFVAGTMLMFALFWEDIRELKAELTNGSRT